MMHTIQRGAAITIGAILVVVGMGGLVLHFIAPRELLFGAFLMDPAQSLLYLASGTFLLAAEQWLRRWIGIALGVIGVLYGVLGCVSFFTYGQMGGMVFNVADRLLQIILAVFALYIGFPIQAPRQDKHRALPHHAWDKALHLPTVREAEGSLL